MSRVKTFDATGISPGGVIFAGDLNAIQDQYADIYNLLQTIGVASLAIGESGLQIVRYGTGEARLTGHFRTDGIMRALGGLVHGQFTSTQRDAIPAGSRPFGLHILNTTTGQIEWNSGTDASPNWIAISASGSQVPIGSVVDWPWASGNVPTNYLLPYGQAVSRTTFAALHAIALAAGYPYGSGDGSTTFNLPDYRGRIGVGKDDMGGTAAGRITVGSSGINATTLGATGGAQTVALATGEMPAHTHGITGTPSRTGSITLTGSPTLTGAVSNGTLSAAVGSLALPSHAHSISDPTHGHGISDPTHGHGSSGGATGGANPNAPGTAGPMGSTDQAVTIPFPGFLINASGTGITVNGASTGITVGAPTSTPAISGSPTLAGSVSNGTLAAGIGTLAVSDTVTIGVGSLATASVGSGTAHQNVQPVIVVNKIMRVA
jgi:microcystin-dependent protein